MPPPVWQREATRADMGMILWPHLPTELQLSFHLCFPWQYTIRQVRLICKSFLPGAAGWIAQLVEQVTLNLRVTSLSPRLGIEQIPIPRNNYKFPSKALQRGRFGVREKLSLSHNTWRQTGVAGGGTGKCSHLTGEGLAMIHMYFIRPCAALRSSLREGFLKKSNTENMLLTRDAFHNSVQLFEKSSWCGYF